MSNLQGGQNMLAIGSLNVETFLSPAINNQLINKIKIDGQ
jgi:hypothetical protein